MKEKNEKIETMFATSNHCCYFAISRTTESEAKFCLNPAHYCNLGANLIIQWLQLIQTKKLGKLKTTEASAFKLFMLYKMLQMTRSEGQQDVNSFFLKKETK